MKSSRRTIAMLLLGLTALLGVAWAAGPAARRDVGEDLSARERWARLSEEERVRLRERYQRYMSMDLAERREIVERASNLKRWKQRVVSRLSPEERERLKRLDPAKREEVLGDLVEDELRFQGRRLREKLPEAYRERLEKASPGERRRFFAEFKTKNRARTSLIALEKMGRHLGKDPAEIQDWKRQPEDVRLQKVLEWSKLLSERSIEEHGLPDGLTPDRWAEIQALPADEFFVEVMRLGARGARRGPAPAEVDPSAPEATRKHRAAEEIVSTWRPVPSDWLELSHLPPEERRAEIAIRRRQRIQGILERYRVFGPDQLDELQRASDDEFYARVRRLVRQTGVMRESRLDPRPRRRAQAPARPQSERADRPADREPRR